MHSLEVALQYFANVFLHIILDNLKPSDFEKRQVKAFELLKTGHKKGAHVEGRIQTGQ